MNYPTEAPMQAETGEIKEFLSQVGDVLEIARQVQSTATPENFAVVFQSAVEIYSRVKFAYQYPHY